MQGWPRTLTWNDFAPIQNPGPRQFVALNGHPIVARVALSIMFYPGNSPRVQRDNEWKFGSVDVRVVLDRAQTQYVPSRVPRAEQARLLRHEQGHMDLMGLFARELEAALIRLRTPTAEALGQQANTMTDEAVRSARMYAINVPGTDCIYDQETNHGMRREVQEQWNRRIAANIARANQPDFIVQIT